MLTLFVVCARFTREGCSLALMAVLTSFAVVLVSLAVFDIPSRKVPPRVKRAPSRFRFIGRASPQVKRALPRA